MTHIQAKWLEDPAVQHVCDVLTKGGAEVYFVGGCVRNALLGVPVSDLDLSTNVPPQRVMALAEEAGIKAIPTGIDHGTVTLVYRGTPYEITTFRRDVVTDGRRAVVAFSDRIEEDAARRDFTMNALYARPDGGLVDPLNGLPDLRARLVRFIGSSAQRIREDYLRSLRYFRFHSWYGNPDAGFDPDALSAIAENLDGIGSLSRERVGSEVLKLLAAPDPAPAIAVMRQVGLLSLILPGSDDRALGPLVHLEGGRLAEPLCRLAALGGDAPWEALRLSKAQAADVRLLRAAAEGTDGPAELAYHHGANTARNVMLLRSALLEMPITPDLEAEITKGAGAVFPLSAKDLMPDLQGAALGAALKSLQKDWIKSGFMLDRDALLKRLL
ncbi:CCA tRNA nucleotidyltransferase [Phaeobacter gallaeciensis]|uniref:tRNA-nucleotidyltransferase n=1 Tax=Phaeobacter gallaeciensis TaxID=60890 RepID=A0AAC9ZCM4_9RHOB|nr:CCA tRNA nucleotidyltransferase [Phaeobacter gallaeciensis]AHD11266.1 tRNA nucleotidyltransferase/poly(A) polymerase [Phaeobacter gallaeciensis DSM 26640]ATE94529.1 putative tRNA-nucleotidyltransferase [Phaeobacter gallaeciensis]ATE98802.1 putative tRNA-nucleotidyltransferase [Phaeobacter gallaeciensis]ATF03193.1 putative tRNA-nucleotidyltransferase [Phaeobacter gallaeciensis]ATF07573.1 putative tRNA-nucleotidyltransferase [Phaeobacter gallaeciensis]